VRVRVRVRVRFRVGLRVRVRVKFRIRVRGVDSDFCLPHLTFSRTIKLTTENIRVIIRKAGRS
jgi:hypothetical protein